MTHQFPNIADTFGTDDIPVTLVLLPQYMQEGIRETNIVVIFALCCGLNTQGKMQNSECITCRFPSTQRNLISNSVTFSVSQILCILPPTCQHREKTNADCIL